MGLEVVTHISDLNASNPVGATDPKSQGDDHIRNIKLALKTDLHNITGVVDATHTQLNYLKSATGTTGTTSTNLVFSTSPTLTTPTLTSPTLTGTVTFPSHGIADAALSTNVPLLNVANTFTAAQTINPSIAQALNLKGGASGNSNTVFLAIQDSGGTRQSYYGKESSANSTIALGNEISGGALRLFTNGGSITLDGVASTDFARLSQSNTFTGAVQTIQAASDTLLLLNATSASDAYLRLGTANTIRAYIGSPGASSGIVTGSAVGDLGIRVQSGSILLSNDAGNTISHKFTSSSSTTTLNGIAVSDFARKSQANTFTAKQTVTIADDVNLGLDIVNTSAHLRFYGFSSDRAYIQALVTGDSGYSPLELGATALTLNATSFDFKAGTVTTNNASASEVGYKGLPFNSQSGDYTTVLADAGKFIYQTGSSKTVTIARNASVAYPPGTVISGIFTASGGGSVKVDTTGGTDALYLEDGTLGTTGTRTVARGTVWRALKIDSVSWVITGAGVS